MTKVIGLDLDGVLYAWHEAVFEYHSVYKNYTGTFDSLWGKEDLKFSDADWEFLINIDYLYSCQFPTPDCTEFIDGIKDRFDIYYITSRPLYVKTTTEQYLRRFNFPFLDNLLFVDDKVNTARRIQADYFIDDLPKHVEGLSKVTNTIMVARPYNKEYWDKYKTVFSLCEALQYLDD